MPTYVWDRRNDKSRYTFGQTTIAGHRAPHGVGAIVVVVYDEGILLLDVGCYTGPCISLNETVHGCDEADAAWSARRVWLVWLCLYEEYMY